MVIDTLLADAPQFMTSHLLQNVSFGTFLNECCRLTWMMVVMQPPMFISTEMQDGKVQSKLHQMLAQSNRTAISTETERIDYYAWPVLYSKQQGDVLHTGTVAVKHQSW